MVEMTPILFLREGELRVGIDVEGEPFGDMPLAYLLDSMPTEQDQETLFAMQMLLEWMEAGSEDDVDISDI